MDGVNGGKAGAYFGGGAVLEEGDVKLQCGGARARVHRENPALGRGSLLEHAPSCIFRRQTGYQKVGHERDMGRIARLATAKNKGLRADRWYAVTSRQQQQQQQQQCARFKRQLQPARRPASCSNHAMHMYIRFCRRVRCTRREMAMNRKRREGESIQGGRAGFKGAMHSAAEAVRCNESCTFGCG